MEKITEYIDYIAKKRDELGGHAICPYVKKYMDMVEIKFSNMITYEALLTISNYPKNKKVVLVCSEDLSTPFKLLDKFCQRHQTKELWLAADHPDRHSEINGVRTNNEHYAMILIQEREHLIELSNRLKHTKYDDFWSKEYFKEIVNDRME